MFSLAETEHRARQDFAEHVGELNTIVYRGLLPNPEHMVEGYVDVLPKVAGIDLLAWLNGQFEQGNPPTICDVGFGKGLFLVDIAQKFKGFFNCIGLGSLEASSQMSRTQARTEYPPTIDLLADNGIAIVEGNVLDIDSLLPPESVDLITMSNVLGYVRFPRNLLFERMHNCLKPGGQIVSGDSRRTFYEPTTDGSYLQTKNFLEQLGIGLQIGVKEYLRPGQEVANTSYTTHLFSL